MPQTRNAAQKMAQHRAAHRLSARKILFIIYTGWFVALAFGSLLYQGEPVTVKKDELPLKHFDYFFRRVGGAVIFGAWFLRAVVKHTLHLRGDGRTEHIWIPAGFYAIQAVLRSAVYEMHRVGLIFSPHRWLSGGTPVESDQHPGHVMSDHVLLAATVVGGLACEVVVLNLSLANRRHKMSPILLKALAVSVSALALLVCAECYYTAKYFHPPSEIIAGAVLGLILFQAPLLLFSAKLLQAHEDGDSSQEHRTS